MLHLGYQGIRVDNKKIVDQETEQEQGHNLMMN